MEKIGEDSAAKFINALIKSVQTLCHGYLDFQSGIEIIGHINLSVDKGNSLDYILKEKVCKNAENSTLFISNSFHAEGKPEERTESRQSQTENRHRTEHTQPTDHSEGGRISSAISSISSSLSGLHYEKHKRTPNTKESHSVYSQHKSSSKRKSSLDQTDDFNPAKISHLSTDSVNSRSSSFSSNHPKVRLTHRGFAASDNGSETLLPQTAGVGDNHDIGVNLEGSVLEPVENQNDSDLARRDDDSDGELEVTFIKEEYGGQGDNAGFDSGGHMFPGPSEQRDGSSFPGATSYMPGSFDGAQFSSGDAGPSTSQQGPSGVRGFSGIQSIVNSLSAFGSIGAPGLPLSHIGLSAGTSKHNRIGVPPDAPGSDLSVQGPSAAAFNKSQSALQRAFALHREDKLRKVETQTDEDMKQRLELMSELLSLKGISSTEDYKTALLREKRRLSKKIYRSSLSEVKRNEIKEKDKIQKRLKRAAKWAASESMTGSTPHFSDCSSDVTYGKDFDSTPRTDPSFAGNFSSVGSVSVASVSDKGQGGDGSAPRLSIDSSTATKTSTGSESVHGMGSESLRCDSRIDPSSSGIVSRIGSGCLGNIPRMCSSSSHVPVGTNPMESLADVRLAVTSSGMGFGSVGSAPWIDSVSFDNRTQEQRHIDSEQNQTEGYNFMKLSQR